MKPTDGSAEQPARDRAANGWTRRSFLTSLGRSAVTAAALGATGIARGVSAETKAAPKTNESLGPGVVSVTLIVNGVERSLQVEPRMTLLEALRLPLGLTGAKESCDRATCGACTVLVNDTPVYACSMLAVEAHGAAITTIEGLARDERLTTLQQAFVDHDGLQCGYCSPGMVMVLTALLRKNPHPTEAEIRRACSGNLCRCGSYPRIFAAALDASGQTPANQVTVLTTKSEVLT